MLYDRGDVRDLMFSGISLDRIIEGEYKTEYKPEIIEGKPEENRTRENRLRENRMRENRVRENRQRENRVVEEMKFEEFE